MEIRGGSRDGEEGTPQNPDKVFFAICERLLAIQLIV